MSDRRRDYGPAGCADGCATSGCGKGCLVTLVALIVFTVCGKRLRRR